MEAVEYLREGIAYYEEKRYRRAIEAFTKALEIEPEYPEAYYNRGLAKLDSERYDEAIADFDAAINLFREPPEIYYYRGIAYERKGELDKAILSYAAADNWKDTMPLARYRAAVLFDKLKYEVGAISWYKSFLRKAKDQLPVEAKHARKRLEELRAIGAVEPRTLKLKKHQDFSNELDGYFPISICVNFRNEVLLLASSRNLESFLETVLDEPVDFLILLQTSAGTEKIIILKQNRPYYFAQMLSGDQVLLVQPRARLYEDGTHDKNAVVFSRDGQFVREFLIGDGVQDVQVTPDNQATAIFFDEGWYGNFGWTFQDKEKTPIGCSGMIRVDTLTGSFEKIAPADYSSSWITALNCVDDREIWCVYDGCIGSFKKRVVSRWRTTINSANAFSVFGDHVVISCATKDDGHATAYLCELLELKCLGMRGSFRFVDEEGQLLRAAAGRGPYLYLTSNSRDIYRMHVEDLLAF